MDDPRKSWERCHHCLKYSNPYSPSGSFGLTQFGFILKTGKSKLRLWPWHDDLCICWNVFLFFLPCSFSCSSSWSLTWFSSSFPFLLSVLANYTIFPIPYTGPPQSRCWFPHYFSMLLLSSWLQKSQSPVPRIVLRRRKHLQRGCFAAKGYGSDRFYRVSFSSW